MNRVPSGELKTNLTNELRMIVESTLLRSDKLPFSMILSSCQPKALRLLTDEKLSKLLVGNESILTQSPKKFFLALVSPHATTLCRPSRCIYLSDWLIKVSCLSLPRGDHG
ncbi:hypothetical protein Plhal703r1_c17g0079881 [Plasmopara halstedii]